MFMEKRVLAVYRKWRRMVSGSTIIVYICDFLDYGCQPLYDFDNDHYNRLYGWV